MGIKNNPRSGMSWSGVRKILEQENICSSLKGRIQYFQTRYRGAHDQIGRVAIRLDDKEIFNSDYFDHHQKEFEIGKKSNVFDERGWYLNNPVGYKEVLNEVKNQGGYASFYNAFYDYHNISIDKSLSSADPMVRLFAILDRRVGKRRLQKLAFEVSNQPKWLQVFYRLRFEADGIIVHHSELVKISVDDTKRQLYSCFKMKIKYNADFQTLGTQLEELLLKIALKVESIAWYVFDTNNDDSFNEPIDYYENTILLADKVKKIEQFHYGVFIAVGLDEKINWDNDYLPDTEEDEGIQHKKAILEIRAMDTSYFEVYFRDLALASIFDKLGDNLK